MRASALAAAKRVTISVGGAAASSARRGILVEVGDQDARLEPGLAQHAQPRR